MSRKYIKRREFLKRSSFITAGALGYLYGVKPAKGSSESTQSTGNRVVWTHDSQVTNWNGSGYYGDYVDQQRLNAMLETGLIFLTGEANINDAWNSLLVDYNNGDKIAIKVNINNRAQSNSIDALPPLINAVIGSLVDFGFSQTDIYVVEPSRVFPTVIGDPILDAYPNVLLWDVYWGGTYGHRSTYNSNDPSLIINHLHPNITDSILSDQIGEVKYLINMPIIKGHYGGAGITLAFKNYFGLFEAINKFHDYTYIASSSYSYDMNPLHDIYLNTHVRNKTILIVGDAIYGHRISNAGVPEVWTTFNNEFPNSLFLSSDPVAVDSVMFDFSNYEYAKPTEAQLYLHRAEEFGLGTHDHWTNPITKLYANIDFRQIEMSQINRSNVDQIIKEYKSGNASRQEVKNVIDQYLKGSTSKR